MDVFNLMPTPSLIVFVFFICRGLDASPDDSGAAKAIESFRASGDLSAVRSALALANMQARGSSELQLSQLLRSVLQIAVTIRESIDPSVDLNAAIWPHFDATKLGGRPIFAGTDPASIKDANLRRHYQEALKANQIKLESAHRERTKTEVAEDAEHAHLENEHAHCRLT